MPDRRFARAQIHRMACGQLYFVSVPNYVPVEIDHDSEQGVRYVILIHKEDLAPSDLYDAPPEILAFHAGP